MRWPLFCNGAWRALGIIVNEPAIHKRKPRVGGLPEADST
jgi:hypothetical protein